MGLFDKLTDKVTGKESGAAVTPVVEETEVFETVEECDIVAAPEETAPAEVSGEKKEVPLLRQEPGGTYIMERDNEILTWNENLLTYQKRNKVIEFALDGTIVIEFVNESGLIGGRELIIWDKNKGLFGKNTQDNLQMCNIEYKKAVSISYSKKEADVYHDIYQKLINTLGDKINPFCWTQEIEPLLFDETHNMIQDDDNHFYRFEDIKDVEIMEDGDTIMGGSVGQALIGGLVLGQAGNVAGTVTKKNTSSTVNSLDIKISLNALEGSGYIYSFLKKSCAKTDKEYRLAIGTAQQLYASLLTIIQK
ncbi:MAG: hypothetical protein IJ471_06310 [Eubacterium sp.]|nr:hypothetical protein [Eubacterium sp.]